MRRVHAWVAATVAAGSVGVAVTALPAAVAETPREMLIHAAFVDTDKNTAMARITRARAGATALVARSADDQDAAIVQATALAYHAKLSGNRGEALAARHQFEALVARYPRNPEASVALGAWHIGIVVSYGRIAGRVAVGADPIYTLNRPGPRSARRGLSR